jgi:hypothetical protein
LWWGAGKPGKWSDRDLLLSMALTAYEESLCSGCGQPKDEAYNPDAEGWYEAHEVTCAGCKAQQDHGNGKKEPTPGAKVYVVDSRPAEVKSRSWSLPSSTQPNDDAADDQADPE